MLKPGTYKLTRDVTNPKPDRRKTSDWRAKPKWSAGSQFIVTERHPNLDDALEGLSDAERAEVEAKMVTTEINLVGNRWSHMNVREVSEPEQHAALEAALEAIPETHEAMFTRLGVPSEYFTRWLVESGRLTPSAFEKLWETYQERTDDKGPELTSAEIDPVGASLRTKLDALDAQIHRGIDAKLEWWAQPWPCGHNDPVYRGPTAQACAICGLVRTDPASEKPDRFRWLIEIDVAEVWVEDGFDVDNERALGWLAKDLGYANIGMELDARVVARPRDEAIAKAQGYEEDLTRWRRDNAATLKTFGQWVNRRSRS